MKKEFAVLLQELEKHKTSLMYMLVQNTSHVVSSTLSEIVVPIKSPDGEVFAVLDIDSDYKAAFTSEDIDLVERICSELGQKYHVYY